MGGTLSPALQPHPDYHLANLLPYFVFYTNGYIFLCITLHSPMPDHNIQKAALAKALTSLE